jgi:Tfp pilus assembly protein PilO
MASSSIINELGKKPPAVKAGVLLGAIVVLGGLYWQLVYSGMRKEIQAAEEQANALVADDQQLDREEDEFKSLSEKKDVLDKMIKENDTALPTAAQIPSFFDMLNRKVGEAGVDVLDWTYAKELQVEETIFKVPVEITVQGTFYELKKFFHLLYKMNETDRDAAADEAPELAADVEDRDRILTIEDLHIREPEIRNNELLLTASFRASTFRKEAPAAEAPADDKKSKAKKANTKNPAVDAKAKTEGAMEKSEDRAKSAGGADAPAKEGL